MRKTICVLAVTMGSALAVVPAFATSVTGEANISGTATVNTTGIYFNATGTGTETSQNPFFVGAPNTNSFSGLSSGTISNIVGGPMVGSHPITDFMTFNVSGVSPVLFDLTGIDAGSGTAAPCAANAIGQACTPTGSPFTLTQLTANTVEVGLVLEGIAYTGTSASGSSQATAIYTTQVVPGTDTSILTAAGTTGFTHSFSGTVSAAVPEPGSLLLMGVGLFGAGLIARRKVRK